MRFLRTVVFIGIILAVGYGNAQASLITYNALLNGLSESPANASPGTGFGVIVFDTVANLLTIDVSFSGLTGTTTASHIHCCTTVPLTGTAGVATTTPTFAGFPSGVTSGTYHNVLDLTLASSYNPSFVTANGSIAASEALLISGAAAGTEYLNIHSSTFPGGEIRGFLTPAVPEPASLVLLGTGLASVAARQRRRRRIRSHPEQS